MSQTTDPMGPMGPLTPYGQTELISPLGPLEPDPVMPPLAPDDGGSDGGSGGGSAPTVSLRAMARVDLMPLQIIEARRFGRVRRGVFALVAVSVAAAVAAAALTQSGVSAAQQQLAVAQAAQQAAISAQAKYSSLPALEAQLATARSSRAVAMGQDVLWYRQLNDLQNSLPTGVTLTTINSTMSAASATTTSGATSASGGASAGPLTPTGIGAFQFGGTASSYAVLAGWLNAVATVTGVSGVALTSASEAGSASANGQPISFSVTAVMTADALSNRYTKEAS